MFVGERIIYLQMEKTASTHLARVLAEVVGGEQHVQHVHLRRPARGGGLGIDPAGRLVFASIRNPWSWYLSLWAYGCRGGGGRSGRRHRLTSPPPTWGEISRDALAQARRSRRPPVAVLREGRAERTRQRQVRTDLWRPLYEDADDVERFRAWLRLVYDPERAHELFPQFGDTDLRFHAGYMTFRYLWNFSRERGLLRDAETVAGRDAIRAFDRAHTMLDDMVVVDRLAPELRRVLGRAGYEVEGTLGAAIDVLAGERTNESPHKPDREYYDDESLALVAEREWLLLERFGLEPPA